MSRSTRKAPFCWQEKKINRIIRKIFKENKALKAKMLLLYATITEIDSDFNGKDIKYYTKTITTYSGLSKDFIPKGLKELEELEIINIKEERNNGKLIGRTIVFTPEKTDEIPCVDKEMPPKPFTGKPVKGKTFTGKTATLEDSTIKEDSIVEEDTPYGVDKSTEPNDITELEKYGKKINLVLSEFTKGDKMFTGPKVFGRKIYRQDCLDLIKKFGVEPVLGLVKMAIFIRGKMYAPVITNPSELRKDMVKIEAYLKKENEKNNIKSGQTIKGTDFSQV